MNKIDFKHLLVFLMSSLLLSMSAGCADDSIAEKPRLPIMLTAGKQGNLTRALDTIQGSSFIQDQDISIYITASDKSVDITTTDGTAIDVPSIYKAGAAKFGVNPLTAPKQPYFPNGNVPVDIYAYYPATVTKINNYTFKVKSSQIEDEDYMASDLMSASVTSQAKTEQTINLLFEHKMAKLIINAESEDDDLEITGIKIDGVMRDVVFDAIANTLGTLSNQGQIEMSNHGAVLIPAQTVKAQKDEEGKDIPFITVETNKGPAEFILTEKEFESGELYTVNIAVNKFNLGNSIPITKWPTAAGTISVVGAGSKGFEMGEIYADNDPKGHVTYTGSAFEPTPTIESGGKLLTLKDKEHPDGHYTLSWYSNTDAGTAVVIAMGEGTYEGNSAVGTFVIDRADGWIKFDFNKEKKVTENFHAGKKFTQLVKTNGDGVITYTSSNSDVADVNPQTGEVTLFGVGTATITATQAPKNYNEMSDSYTVVVTPGSISGSDEDDPDNPDAPSIMTFTLDYEEIDYNGTERKPNVIVKDGDTQLKKGTSATDAKADYWIEYSNNIEGGTATAKVIGLNNYAGSEKELTFKIKQVTNSWETWTASKDTYYIAKGSTLDCTAVPKWGTGTVKYTLTYSSGDEGAVTMNGGIATGAKEGTYKLTISVAQTTSYTGLSKDIEITSEVKVYNFSSFGKETFKPKRSTTYKLQVWGAQGGGNGGLGGYAEGTISLTTSDILYIYVGGVGGSNLSEQKKTSDGGYNGGGAGGYGSPPQNSDWSAGNFNSGAGGGGATHIAKKDGLLKDLASNKDDVLLVAGGGGGHHWGSNVAGWGGGENGGSTTQIRGSTFSGGSQTGGYKFGLGQDGASKDVYGSSGAEGNSGCGGGWYGGTTLETTGGTDTNCDGSGGSGHVNTSKLNSGAKTIAGNEEFESPEGGTETGHAGNGYAKISIVDVD